MENDPSRVVDILLENIFLNNMIKDRQTLLTGRLVCRAWRASRAFSSPITAVTLHTLADLQLATQFLPHTQSGHPSEQHTQDSTVFPNVNTLKISRSLLMHLNHSSASRELLASIGKLDVEVSIYPGEQQKVLIIAGLVSSLRFLRSKSPASLCITRDVRIALTRLTRLTIDDVAESPSFFTPCFYDAEDLPTLRHLQLFNFPIKDDETTDPRHLARFFALCSAPTQLTKLDISVNSKRFFPYFFGGIKDLDHSAIKRLAPKALNMLSFLVPEGNDQFENLLHAIWTPSVMKIQCYTCAVRIETPMDLNLKVPQQICKACEYGASSLHLTVSLLCKVPEAGIFIDLTKASSLLGLRLSFQFLGPVASTVNVFTSDFYKLDVFNSGRCTRKVPEASCTRPVLTCNQGVLMAATRLELETRCASAMDLTDMALRLPALFPDLQHLELCTDAGSFDNQDCICRLTRLTHLSISIGSQKVSRPPFVPPSFPASLLELSLSADRLKLQSLPGLEHLTKLTLLSRRSDSTCTLDAVYGCNAPVRDLSLRGFQLQVDMLALVTAFPHLGKLEVEVSSYDVTPLSSLHLLNKLTVHIADLNQPMPMLAGNSEAHNLRDGSSQLAKLACLAKLTWLRHLEILIHKASHALLNDDSNKESRILSAINSSKCHDLLQQLYLGMPYTAIKLSIDAEEVHV